MKLIRLATSETVPLEDGFLWPNEFSWKAIEQNQNYAIDGSLVVQEGKKKSGRPITLQPADKEMGWIKLRELLTVLEWSKLQNEVFQLQFEQPHDSRQFTVKFNHQDGALEADPVKGIPAVSLDDYYNVTLRFTELNDGD
ncbi:hypothetical protein E0H88_03870 [Acinetobacter sp. ANC 4216]|uniref:hypothetical protein n=1 Tax=Acinetobacter sp. ANC 4216 TaxID=2529840 RepID=UPI001039D1F5|nr:hypothetical protein [Acinetobacter sp. ANC 4216]TCB71570.1 hypothetical protein E0H88_03870 [Acinetobacter sp. ANC 4216]